MLTFSSQPNESADETQETQVAPRQLLKAGEEASIMLDLVNEALHQMPLPVKVLVIVPRRLQVGPRWNDWHGALVQDELEEGSGVISFVPDHMLNFKINHQGLSLGDVMALPCGQLEAQRVAQSIHAHVDLGTEPASAASQSLGSLTALFLEAPAAQGWARTMVLSIMRFSISGSWMKC